MAAVLIAAVVFSSLPRFPMAAVLIAAVVSLGVFYLLILIVGVTAARCVKVGGSRSGSGAEVRESEEVVVAGRTLHGVVGVMTMIGKCLYSYFTSQTATTKKQTK